MVFRSKLWWGLLLDENKRKRGKQYEGSESRYWVRMIAAGWLSSAQAQPPGKKERCIACARGRPSLWCKQCKSFFHGQCIPGFDCKGKDAKVIWCPPCMSEWDTEEQSKLDTCSLCSSELPGGGSAWHVMSSCSHTGLQAQRERMAGPFEAVVKATIKELDRGKKGHREEVSEAFRRTPTGTWVAPAGWAGKGRADGRHSNQSVVRALPAGVGGRIEHRGW